VHDLGEFTTCRKILKASDWMRACVLALAWARVPAWACCLGGGGGRSGLMSGGLASKIGSLFGGWSIGSIGSSSLLLAENYNRTTTDQTAESQSAQRLNGGGRNSLQLDDLAWLWAIPVR
jgi:hypothetical protein